MTVDREIYSIFDDWSSLFSGLKEKMRGINDDYPGVLSGPNWCHYENGELHVNALSKSYNGSSWTLHDPEFGEVSATGLKDQYVTTGIPIGESGETALNGAFNAASFVGALNELKGQIGGDSEWERVVIDANNDYVIPLHITDKYEFVHTADGLMDSYVDPGIVLGESGETALHAWFSPKVSFLGAINKLASDIGAWTKNEFDTDLWEIIPTISGVPAEDIYIDIGGGFRDGDFANEGTNDALRISEFGAQTIHDNFNTSSIMGMLNELAELFGTMDRLNYDESNVRMLALSSRVECQTDLRMTELIADRILGLDSNLDLEAIAPSSVYTPTNVTPDRAFDADTVVITELADVVGTLIADLQTINILG